MMEDSIRIAIINKEIETYRKFAVVLESLKPVIRSFNGKCINKKFTESIDEFLKYGNEERSYSVNTGIILTSYGNVFHISIYCYDDLVKDESDSGGYYTNYRINNSECSMRFDAKEVMKIVDGGKPRLHAKALVEKFDEKIQCLHNKAEELEKDLSHVEQMRADMEQIKQLMAVFNGKYHRRIKEVFNCNYSLKNDNGMRYR